MVPVDPASSHCGLDEIQWCIGPNSLRGLSHNMIISFDIHNSWLSFSFYQRLCFTGEKQFIDCIMLYDVTLLHDLDERKEIHISF